MDLYNHWTLDDLLAAHDVLDSLEEARARGAT